MVEICHPFYIRAVKNQPVVLSVVRHPSWEQHPVEAVRIVAATVDDDEDDGDVRPDDERYNHRLGFQDFFAASRIVVDVDHRVWGF